MISFFLLIVSTCEDVTVSCGSTTPLPAILDWPARRKTQTLLLFGILLIFCSVIGTVAVVDFTSLCFNAVQAASIIIEVLIKTKWKTVLIFNIPFIPICLYYYI